MKKISILVTLTLLSLTLTSCFEIIEKIQLNKDGSGSYSLILDMGEMKSMVQAMNPDGDLSKGSPFSEMEAEFSITREKLEATEGISNIRFYAENEGFEIITAFDFSDMDALNKAIQAVYNPEEDIDPTIAYYTFKRKRFERTPERGYIESLKEEMNADDLAAESMDLSSYFEDVSYTVKVELNGRKARKVLRGNPVISEDGTSFENRYFIFKDEQEQPFNFEVKLR